MQADTSDVFSKAVGEGETEFDPPLAAFLDTCRDRLIATSCTPDDGVGGGYLQEDKVHIFQQIIKNANEAMKAIRTGDGRPYPHLQDVVNLAFILNELHIADQE